MAEIKVKASEYTAQVPWLGSNNALPRSIKQRDPCPFTLAITKAETCAKEEENVESCGRELFSTKSNPLIM